MNIDSARWMGETYSPLTEQPAVQGDSLHTPFVVGRLDFGESNGHTPVDFSDLPHFEAKVGLVDRRQSAANEAGHSEVATPLENVTLTMRDPWAKYRAFVPVAEVFRDMSKMPGTKVGCVVLGTSHQVLATGWNGAARGCSADCDDRLDTRESRLDWVVHAEANAVANAARSGVSLSNSVAICTYMPCMTCAKLLVQAGVIAVLCPAPTSDDARWQREFDLTRRLFSECGVHLDHYDKET